MAGLLLIAVFAVGWISQKLFFRESSVERSPSLPRDVSPPKLEADATKRGRSLDTELCSATITNRAVKTYIRTHDAGFPPREVSGQAVPRLASPPPSPPTASVQPTDGGRRRRCTCSSTLDTECIYYCHMDIIWVNTAVRAVPYGVGSRTRGRRRATRGCTLPEARPGERQRGRCTRRRCSCSGSDDQHCRDFCRITGTRKLAELCG